MGVNSGLLKALGLMTAGAGAAAYGLSPEDAEAARMPWQQKLADVIKRGVAESVDFGPVEGKLLNQLMTLDKRYLPGDLTIPKPIVQKFIDKRVGKDGLGADAFVDDLNSLFHSSKSKALESDFPGRQQIVNAGERMSMLGASEPVMGGGGAVITGYPVPTKRLQRKLNSAPGGRVVSTIPSPFEGAGDQPTRLSDVGADSMPKIMLDGDDVKKILGIGLLGAGAYGLSSPDDAQAMYIGPKGLSGLMGSDVAKAMLTDAERMASSGLDNEAVRQATGLFQGMDGKWRFEVPDDSAAITAKTGARGLITQDASGKYTNKPDVIGDALSHNDLFQAYPDLKNIRYEELWGKKFKNASGGAYRPGEGFSDERIFIAPNETRKSDTTLETLLHELQHGVQSREGFATGGTPRDPAYNALAGEIEARDVANRINFTPEQRRAAPPDLRQDAIVRYGDGTAASVPQRREWAKEAGNNTPNVAQAITPSDPFAPSSSQLAATVALVSALRAKDQPLEDTYQPADMLTAFLTGGGGLMSRGIQAALDPAVSAAFDYAPKIADAINPRNIIMGLMR